MTSITHTSFYNVTCKVCVAIRNVLVNSFKAMIRAQEAAGRARAAHHLSNMGYYKEAKDVMLGVDKD
jgi:hypothetical protein